MRGINDIHHREPKYERAEKETNYPPYEGYANFQTYLIVQHIEEHWNKVNEWVENNKQDTGWDSGLGCNSIRIEVKQLMREVFGTNIPYDLRTRPEIHKGIDWLQVYNHVVRKHLGK